MIPLFAHQKQIIEEDPLWSGIWLGTGGGKTRVALELAEGKILIITPKQQFLDYTWERNAEKFGINKPIVTISKEKFRSTWEELGSFDTVIIDEAHNHFGVLPDTRQRKGKEIPKASQLFEATLGYIRKHNPKRFYLCSATPASKPMNIFAIATLLGNEWDYFRFREKFYIQRKSGFRSIWLPKNTIALKEELVNLVKQLGYTGTLSDWFDVPEQTHETIYLPLTDDQKSLLKELKESEADPMVKRTKKRTIENGCLYEMDVESIDEKRDRMFRSSRTISNEKVNYILERAEEFDKMLIFANYIAQVKDIADNLEKAGFRVLTLTGETKDRQNIISKAENADKCIVIAQSGISSGYELKSISCVIFASKSWRFLDYDQGVGRVLRADAIKKNLYLHLVVRGGADEDCHDAIMRGEDFQERIHAS